MGEQSKNIVFFSGKRARARRGEEVDCWLLLPDTHLQEFEITPHLVSFPEELKSFKNWVGEPVLLIAIPPDPHPPVDCDPSVE